MIQDCYLSADITLQKGANLLNTDTIVNYLPRSLNSWAKCFQLAVNGVNVIIVNTNNFEVLYLMNLIQTNAHT